MKRDLMIDKMQLHGNAFDFIIIGGGASGAGIVLEAASRGYTALLVEKSDFVKSTSSKSTKLVHGGVRYLAQGNIALVREACVERGLLIRNAPHLVSNQSFVIPTYGWFDQILYTVGLTMYDLMAGSYSLGRSRPISKKEVIRRLPTISGKNLTAGVLYYDGQFDDARLAVNVLQTASDYGALLINYLSVNGLKKNNEGKLVGVELTDSISGDKYQVNGKVIINATGVFADNILQMDTPGMAPTMRPSQGVHLVFEKSFLPGNDAVMIPKTDDGRVLFAVPWNGKVVVGTTDTPVNEPMLEPVALESEIDFILETAGRYLKKQPLRKDVLSIFAGLRPLAAAKNGNGKKTREISRSHKIIVSPSGLMTMIGGKWTTFRKMAEDMINKAERLHGLKKTTSITRDMKLRGSGHSAEISLPLHVYGSDSAKILELIIEDPALGESLSDSLPILKAQVIWAVREEMAMTVEDVLSRRTRCQILDARESLRIAPEVARLMAIEMGKDEQWAGNQINAYKDVTENYIATDHNIKKKVIKV
jgi:glycerol-3-phosphate dehydrogenase